MADDQTKKLLLKLGISTNDWKVAVEDIKRQLNTVNEQAKRDAAQMKATQKEQLDLTKQQIAEQQRLTAEARTLSAVDQAKAQWQKQQQEAIRTAVQQQILQTTEAKKQAILQSAAVKASLDQVRLEQQKLRLAEQQNAIANRQAKSQQSSGMFGGIGKFASGISGGGLMGSIVGGAFLGTGFERAMEMGVGKVHELVKALEEATGPAQQLRQEFERLAARTGNDPSVMIENLRKSTRGLVADIDLYKVANNFMKSGLKLTSEQMVKLVSDTVNLGRATGHSATESVQALQRYFLTGRAMTLAMVTGINRQELAVKGLSNTMDPLTRRTLEFNKVSAEEAKMLNRVGVPATTLPELFQQVEVAEKNFIDGVAKGILVGGTFGNSIENLSKKLSDLGPKIEEVAQTIGSNLRDGITFIVEHFGEIKTGIEVLMALKFAQWIFEIGEGLGTMATTARTAAVALGLLKTAEEGAAVVGGATAVAGGAEAGAGAVVGGAAAATVGVVALAASAAVIAGYMLAQYGDKIWYWIKNSIHSVYGSSLDGRQDLRRPVGIGETPSYAKGRFTQAEDVTGKTVSIDKTPGQDVTDIMSLFGNKPSKEDDQQENIALERKLADQRLKLQQAADKASVESLKLAIEQKQALYKQEYEAGLISLQQYVNEQKEIENTLYAAERQQIIKDRDAQLQNIRTKSTVNIEGTGEVQTQDPKEKANAEAIVRVNTQNKLTALELQHNTKIAGLDNQAYQDRIAAYRTYTDEVAKIAKEGVADRLHTLETEFKQGMIGADSYISQRRAMIGEELTITQQGLAERLEAAKNDEQEQAKIRVQGIEAQRTYDKQLTELELQQNDIRLQSIKTHYDQASKYLQVSLATAKASGLPQAGQEEQVTQALYSLAQSQLQALTAQQHNLEVSGNKYGKDWIATTEQMAAAQEEMVKMQLQLIEMRDTAAPLSSIFGSLAGLAGATRTRAGGILSGVFENMQGSFDMLSKFNIANQTLSASGQRGGLFGGLVSSVQNLFHPSQSGSITNIQKTATEIFNQGLTTATSIIHTNTSAIEQGTAAVRAWAAALAPVGKNAQEYTGVPLQSAENQPAPEIDLSEIPHYAGGSDYIPQTGLAVLHQGESVLTAAETRAAAGLTTVVQNVENALNKLVSGVSAAASKLLSLPSKIPTLVTPPPTFVPTSDRITPLPVLGTTAGGQDQGEGSATPLPVPGSGLQQFNTQIKKASEDAVPSFGASLKSLATNIGGIIQGLEGVMKGLTSGKTGGEGALGGASSLGQFGSSVGALAGPMGAVLGGVSGAAVGGIMGGIFGSKEKSLMQDIHKVQTQLQSIVSDLQAGTISLSQAIQDLRNERQQAIQLLSSNPKGGKGGGKGGKKGYTPSQVQSVIQQIDTQIQTLVNEQSQILESLSTSLMEVSNPLQYQEYLQSLDQIIQKYQEFASAAQGNAQEMTAANQYLNDSLNQYVTTLSQNLNQAQQTAINDALELINLEYQRQQMINQEAQSQYDVLTQGVLTEQRTTAMTKGQEIGQIQYQAQMQMEQINEQISLQQYKVKTETQIFNLATTRIGLENQLLDAQESQANYQILQVQALAQVVASLQSGLSGGALMSQITQEMASGAMPTESGIMYALLEMLGLSGNVPPTATQGQYGITNWLSQIPAQDASAAQYVASLDPNFPNMILSGQYAAAAADAQQYATQGEVEGYDMNDFIAWLEQQSQGQAPPGAAAGGDVSGIINVGEKGPEKLIVPPMGGTVLSNPIVNALNAMTGGAQASVPQGGVETDSVNVHQTLYQLTQARTNLEMTVITARQSQISSEMQLLQAMNDTYNNILNGTSPTMGLEDMLQKVYENRGRQGSAGFYRTSV